MKYCTKCSKILINSFIDYRERLSCKSCGHIVYQNPIPVAVVIVVKDGEILLIKRANDPLAGYWAPPSGYIEINETLEEGAAREVLEETGEETVRLPGPVRRSGNLSFRWGGAGGKVMQDTGCRNVPGFLICRSITLKLLTFLHK